MPIYPSFLLQYNSIIMTLSLSKILVVDDEAIVAHDISECLTHLGCEIVGTALSGPDAIEKAGRCRPGACSSKACDKV